MQNIMMNIIKDITYYKVNIGSPLIINLTYYVWR